MSSLMELLKQKKAALTSNNRQKTVKPNEGRTRWRILPGWRPEGAENADIFYHDFGQHFIKDASGTLKAVYVCVNKTYDKPCQICGAIEHAIATSRDDTMVELLKDSKAGQRILMNALAIDSPNPSDPVILEVAPTVFVGILNIIEEWGIEALSLDKGNDIIIERSGKGLLTKYTVQVAAKSAAVDPSVMKRIANLDEYVAQESTEAANRALTNLSAVAGLLPTSSASAGKSSAAVVPADHLRDISMDDDDFPEATKSAPAPVAAASAVATVGGDDAELDALLAELG